MLMGLQMATAYTGSTLMPAVFGLLAQWITVGLYPVYLIVFLAGMMVMTTAVRHARNRAPLRNMLFPPSVRQDFTL